MTLSFLTTLRSAFDHGRAKGVVSVCSAHEWVIEAALLQAKAHGVTALIEATCNQVNQEGGYTGMTPRDFRAFVSAIAAKIGLPEERYQLGGDHLGPNPWKHLPPDEAMAKASDMIAAYAEAGFSKLHLDASMGCRGEAPHLPDATVARRAAQLACRAESVSAGRAVYIIGTEIPTPGGATEALDHVTPTSAEAVRATYEVHETLFREHAPGAWERVIGIVVQPGVEFGDDSVMIYEAEKARHLTAALASMPGLVFEAHSTDYQPEAALGALVRDGFAILKVGPELTFALREALYGLDQIAAFLFPGEISLRDVMEKIMLAHPEHWASHYHEEADALRVQRHFSYSDRIRYYWPHAEARRAVEALISRLSTRALPLSLINQYLPRLSARVRSGAVPAEPRALVVQAISDVLDRYGRACHLHS